jgi:hypothetical protein
LGTLDPGKVLLVNPVHARQLIEAGAALELAVTKMLDEPVVRGPVIGPLPFATRRENASSSRLVRVPLTQTSELSEPDQSSSSTTLGNYMATRKSSTPATARGGTSTMPKSRRGSAASYGRKIRTQRPGFL